MDALGWSQIGTAMGRCREIYSDEACRPGCQLRASVLSVHGTMHTLCGARSALAEGGPGGGGGHGDTRGILPCSNHATSRFDGVMAPGGDDRLRARATGDKERIPDADARW